MKYHVYIQGFTQLGEEEAINDYDEPVAVFEDEEQAIWFATHYPFNAPILTPHAKVIVEERDSENEDFISLILESEIS